MENNSSDKSKIEELIELFQNLNELEKSKINNKITNFIKYI